MAVVLVLLAVLVVVRGACNNFTLTAGQGTHHVVRGACSYFTLTAGQGTHHDR